MKMKIDKKKSLAKSRDVLDDSFGIPISKLDSVDSAFIRDGFGRGLVEAGMLNSNVVVLCCDLSESTRSHWFAKSFPKRFVQVGVAEQNMVGMASGMALEGKIPFCSSYAVFNPGRNWDQIRVSVCYNNANVKIIGAHAGVSVGPDGATHQGLEDIAIMRVLPNMKIIVPCDAYEAYKATLAVADEYGPAYIRFGRNSTPIITDRDSNFRIGDAIKLRSGSDVTICACGSMVYTALEAADYLASSRYGLSVEVINVHTIKPLDHKTLLSSFKKTRAVVTIEEHQITGGLGGAIAELCSEHLPTRMKIIGMPDTFGQSGSPEELLEHYGLTSSAIVRAVIDLVKRR